MAEYQVKSLLRCLALAHREMDRRGYPQADPTARLPWEKWKELHS